MKEHDATEIAYKNGYNKGFADALNEVENAVDSLEYQANTERKTVKIEELKAQVNWVLHDVVPSTIAEIKQNHKGGTKK